jgi:branched-chain amino acid aminotransferase
MHDHVWLNGEVLALGDARLSPASAGALYGWGVFTTLGVREGRARSFARHWERLEAHAARAKVPLEASREHVESGLAALLARAGFADGRARITVLRGGAGLWQTPGGRASDVLILVAERAPRPAAPLALTVSPYRIHTASPLVGVKSTAYAGFLTALDEAKNRGFAEAIVLNERGEVVEATAANVFWARDGELFTPSLGTGCLAGVTRRLVLEVAARLKVRVTEGAWPLAALHEADEVFLTNSGWGLLPVAELDIHRFKPLPGPYTERLGKQVAEAE